MTAFDFSVILFFVAAFVKIMTDFVENDKKTTPIKKVNTTRKANISANAIRTVNAFYQNPRAKRTTLSSNVSVAQNNKKRAVRSAI